MNIYLLNKKFLVLLFLAAIVLPLNIIAQSAMPVGVDSVVITFSNTPTQIEVEKAALKYNKDFALSFQMDDALSDIYNIVYPLFEGVNNTNGLYYSNGCGEDISFKMSTGLNIFSANTGSDLLQDDDPYHDPAKLTWADINILYQSAWGIQNHGVFDQPQTSSDDEIDYEIQRTESYSRRKVSDSLLIKTFIIPNGNLSFVDNLSGNNYHSVIDQETGSEWLNNTNEGIDVEDINIDWLNLMKLNRFFDTGESLIGTADDLNTASLGGVKKWIPWGMHDYPSNFTAQFQYIYNTYGSLGLDNVLITTDTDIVDYLVVKQETQLITVQDGNKLTVTFDGNIPSNRLHYDLSLNVFSDQTISNIEVFGAENSSFSQLGNDTALINLNWDGRYYYPAEYLADSMTTIAVNTESQYDALVAMDYTFLMENSFHKDSLRYALCTIPGTTYDDGFCLDCEIDLGADTTLCYGSCDSIFGPDGFDTYEWIVADTVYSNDQDIFVCPNDTTQFILNAENDICLAIDTIVINIAPTPQFELANDTTLCLNDSLTIYGPDTTGLNYIFEWIVADTLFDTTQNITVHPLDTTQYFLFITNEYDCENIDSMMVFVLPIPIAEIIQGDTIISCIGDSITFSVEGSGIDSYLWSTGDTTQSIKVSPPISDSTYKYFVDIFNGYNCFISDTIWLTVDTVPVVNLYNDTTICLGDSITIYGPDTTGLNYTFEWIVADTLYDTTQNIIVSPLDTTQYFLYVSNSSFCSGSDSVWVYVLDAPIAQIIQEDTLYTCIGDTTIYTIEGENISSYLWSTGDTTASIKVSPQTTDSTYKYYVDVFNESGCSISDTTWLLTYDIPIIGFPYDTITSCDGDSVRISVSISNPLAAQYFIWHYNNNIDTLSTVLKFLPESSVPVYIQVVTFDNCSVWDSIYVQLLEKPDLQVSDDQSICEGETTELAASGAELYYWMIGNDTISTEASLEVSPESTTKYMLIGEMINGCQEIDSVEVVVLASPTTNIIYNDDNPICENSLVTLLGTGADEYLWSTDETTEEISFIITSDTLIKLRGTNLSGCTKNDSISILIKPALEVSFSGLLPAYCENDMASVLIGSPAGGIFSGAGVVGNEFRPTLAGTGQKVIKYSFTNAENCSGSESDTTIVYGSGEVIDLGEDQPIFPSMNIQLDAGEGFDSYYWSTGSTYQNIDINYGDNPPGSIIRYVVIGVINGCTSQGETNITFVDPEGIGEYYLSHFVMYPNPNNGSFTISYEEDVQEFKVFIYDYYGKLIYHESVDCDTNCEALINIPELNRGMYIIKTQSEKGVSSAKLIIQ